MSKELFAVHIPDISAFTRVLCKALLLRHASKPAPPGQVELLNLLARAQGQRNWQSWRQTLRQSSSAAAVLPARDTVAASATEVSLTDTARKALAQFDTQGRLLRWPAKYSVQKLVMWVLWTHFDAKRSYTEREVNAVLKAANLFSDHVTLRRELINHRLMSRQSDCTDYRKLPARPDDETRALLGAWRAQNRSGAG